MTDERELAAKRLVLIELKRRLLGQEQITLSGVLWLMDKMLKELR